MIRATRAPLPERNDALALLPAEESDEVMVAS
jgi:hypothetical protein